MADIFISYASEDQERVKLFAKALEKQGWSIWWDRTIPPGEKFDQLIDEAINAAKCVVVVWSKISIKSDWVKEEANIGKQRMILVPVKIDPVDPPIGFGRIQAADLTSWEAEKSHSEFFSLRNAISKVAGPPPKRDKSEQVNKLPESNLEQQLEVKYKGSETFQPDPSRLKPDEKESPISGPKAKRKRRLVFGIGGIALILVLSVIGWFLYSKPEPEPSSISARVRLLKQNSSKYLAVLGAAKRVGANIVIWKDEEQDDIWWYLERHEENRYKVRNHNSRKYLAVDGGNVIQQVDIGQHGILWDFEQIDSSCYKIRNVNSGKYLAVKNGRDVIQLQDQNRPDIAWCME